MKGDKKPLLTFLSLSLSLSHSGDYDLAGFVVGAVERSKILPNMDLIGEGDVVLGLKSSGIHSNGYSLVRHVVSKQGLDYFSPCPFATPALSSVSNQHKVTLGEALLTPTKIYVKQLLPVIRADLVKSMAHITGGGFIDNIPRALPDHLGVELDLSSYQLPPVFQWLKKAGGITSGEFRKVLSSVFFYNITKIILISLSFSAAYR